MIIGILDRYIGRSILSTSLLVLMVLVVLASIFAFISELDDVGRGAYTVVEALKYIVLTIPGKAYLLFAPAVLLGSLLGLGALASNSELTVMRAAGISNGRIIRAVALTGVALMLLVALIGETIMPRAEQVAEELRLTAMEERLSVRGRNGLWVKSGSHYVSIASVLPDLSLLGLVIHEFDGQRLQRSIRAASASLLNDDWTLRAVEITRFKDRTTTVENLDSIAWKALLDRGDSESARASARRNRQSVLVSADVLKSLSVSPDSLSLRDLYQQKSYLESNQLDSRRIEVAFWSKLFSPFATLVMLMLSLPFVFGSQRSGGAGQKIFIGILLGIVYVLVNRLLTQLLLANGAPPLLSALAPLLLFLIVAVIGIRRIA